MNVRDLDVPDFLHIPNALIVTPLSLGNADAGTGTRATYRLPVGVNEHGGRRDAAASQKTCHYKYFLNWMTHVAIPFLNNRNLPTCRILQLNDRARVASRSLTATYGTLRSSTEIVIVGPGAAVNGEEVPRFSGEVNRPSVRFLNRNGGRISQRARDREFRELTDEEAERIETIYRETFKIAQTE